MDSAARQGYPHEDDDDGDGGYVHHGNWAVEVRHSPWYLVFTVAILVLTTVLLIWVAVVHALPQNFAFVLIELVVTVFIVFDTVLEISYQGPWAFFCYRARNAGVEETHPGPDSWWVERCLHRLRVFWVRYGIITMNWCLVVVVTLCVVGFGMTMSAHTKGEQWEEEASLALLFVRYVVYFVFLVVTQVRSVNVQGGIHRVVKTEHVSEEWDVKF